MGKLLFFQKLEGSSSNEYEVFYNSNLVRLGCIYKGTDGFFVYQHQKTLEGCWSGGVLVELGSFIEDLNKPYWEKLNTPLWEAS